MLRKKRKKTEVEIHSCPAKGIRNGIITDFALAKDQLSLLIEQAEHKFNSDIYQILVGIPGNKTSSQVVEIQFQHENFQIDEKIILSLYKQAIEKSSTTEKIVLHACPLGFQVNGEVWYENPTGMRAKKITARYFVLQGDASYTKEIIRICNESGLKVENLYAAAFASSTPFLSPTLKKMGVGVFDLGGGLSSGIVYIQEKPAESFSVPIGTDSLTQDLSIGFSIPYDEAEKIKRLWGADFENKTEIMEIIDIHGKKKVITKEKTLQILGPRIHEIASFLDKKISKYKSQLGAGILLTGGGSEINGIEKMFNQVLKIPCNLLKPLQFEDKNIMQDPYPRAFSCAVGMLLLEEKNKKDFNLSPPKSSITNRLFSIFSRQT